jgi:inner membrane protein
MPSVFAHAFVGAALGSVGPRSVRGTRLTLGLATIAAAPDLDALGLWLGIPYGHWLGHRGLTHSIAFALLVAPACVALIHPALPHRGARAAAVALLYALACASHGVLDAFTNGGLGIGFFIPFSSERYFFPVRPLMTSSLDPADAFGRRGLAVLRSEARWIGLPTLAFLAVAILARSSRARGSEGDRSAGGGAGAQRG